ncbi:MAG TPA: hypothetical protein EYN69_07575 [Flavobacteriales bacterium]|nr:hypothetical protein [Flavobacteriales bacterium]
MDNYLGMPASMGLGASRWWATQYPYQKNVTHSDAPNEFRFRSAELIPRFMEPSLKSDPDFDGWRYPTWNVTKEDRSPISAFFGNEAWESWNKYTTRYAHSKYGRPGIDIAWEISKYTKTPQYSGPPLEYWEVKDLPWTYEINIAKEACVASSGPHSNIYEGDLDTLWTGAAGSAWVGSDDHPDYPGEAIFQDALRTTYGPNYQFRGGTGIIGPRQYYQNQWQLHTSGTASVWRNYTYGGADGVFGIFSNTAYTTATGNYQPEYAIIGSPHNLLGVIPDKIIDQAPEYSYGWTKYRHPGPFMSPENDTFHDQYLWTIEQGNENTNSQIQHRGRQYDLRHNSFSRGLGFSGIPGDERRSLTSCSTRKRNGDPIEELIPNPAICGEFLHPNSTGVVRVNGIIMGHGGTGGRGGTTSIDESAVTSSPFGYILRGGTPTVVDPALPTDEEITLETTPIAEHPFNEMQHGTGDVLGVVTWFDGELQTQSFPGDPNRLSTQFAPKKISSKHGDFPGGGGGLGWHSGMGGLASTSTYQDPEVSGFSNILSRSFLNSFTSTGEGISSNTVGLFGDGNPLFSGFVWGNSTPAEEGIQGPLNGKVLSSGTLAATWIDFMYGESSAYGNNTNALAHSTGSPPTNPFGIFGRHSYHFPWANSTPFDMDGGWGFNKTLYLENGDFTQADLRVNLTPGGVGTTINEDSRGLQYSANDVIIMTDHLDNIVSSNNNVSFAPIFGKNAGNTSFIPQLEDIGTFLAILDGYSDPGFAHFLARRNPAPGTLANVTGHVKEVARQNWRLANREFGVYDATDKIDLGNGDIWGVSQNTASQSIRDEWALQHGAPADRDLDLSPDRGKASLNSAPRPGSLDSCWRLGAAVRHCYGGTTRPDYVSFYDSPPPGMSFGSGRKSYHQLAIYQYWWGTGYGHGAEFQAPSAPSYTLQQDTSPNGWGLYNTLADARQEARPTWPRLTLTADTSQSFGEAIARDQIALSGGTSSTLLGTGGELLNFQTYSGNQDLWAGLNVRGEHSMVGMQLSEVGTPLMSGGAGHLKATMWWSEGGSINATPGDTDWGINHNGPRAWATHQFNALWPDDFDPQGGRVMDGRYHQFDTTIPPLYGRCSPIERSVVLGTVGGKSHHASGGPGDNTIDSWNGPGAGSDLQPVQQIIDQQGNLMAYLPNAPSTLDTSSWGGGDSWGLLTATSNNSLGIGDQIDLSPFILQNNLGAVPYAGMYTAATNVGNKLGIWAGWSVDSFGENNVFTPMHNVWWGPTAPPFEGLFWGGWRRSARRTSGTSAWHDPGLSGNDGGPAISVNHMIYIVRDDNNSTAITGGTWSLISSGGGGGAGAGYNHPHININPLDDNTMSESAARQELANTGIGIAPGYRNDVIYLEGGGSGNLEGLKALGLRITQDTAMTAGGSDVGWDVADNQAGYGGSIGKPGQGSHNPSHNYDYNTNEWDSEISTGANTYGKYVESTVFQDHKGTTTIDTAHGIISGADIIEFNNQGHKEYKPDSGLTHHADGCPSLGGQSIAIKTVAPSGEVVLLQPESVAGAPILEADYKGLILGDPDPRMGVRQEIMTLDPEWWLLV